MPHEFPARLYVVLAREAPEAVILRRGPNRWVRVILWHTDTDQFEGGQWLQGRIYGERCALSPDGSLFLYFAAQHHKAQGGYKGTWTAISKPPYLTALALWPKGDTWGGGGVFLNAKTIYLWNGCGSSDPHPDHQPPKKLRIITSADQLIKKDHTALARIKAQGWQLFYQPAQMPNAWGLRLDDPPVWHHDHPALDRYYVARRDFGYIPDHYPGPTITEYAFGDRETGREISLEGASWADWDQQGRLAYARDGQLFAQIPQDVGRFARPLADFNDQIFEDTPTPGWAVRW